MTFEELRRDITEALRSDLPRARRLARRYTRLAERDGAPVRQGEALVQQAKVLHVAGRLDEAVRLYDRARRIFLREGAKTSVLTTDISAIQALAILGRSDRAAERIRALRRAMPKDRLLAARVDLAIGNVYGDLGDERAAEEAFRRVLERLRGKRKWKETAEARINLGIRLCRKGAVREALVEFERALTLFEELGYDAPAEQARHNRAWARAIEGDAGQAIEELRAVRGDFKRRGDRRRAALAQLDEAELALRLGDASNAAREAREAARRLARSDAPLESARARLLAARADADLGHRGRARKEAAAARTALSRSGDRAGVAMAAVLMHENLAQAEATLRKTGHLLAALEALLTRARGMTPAAGARLLSQRVDRYPSTLRRWLQPELLLLRARAGGRTRIPLLRKAVRAAEELRRRAPTGGLRAALLASHLECYETLARALVERGRDPDLREAFLVLDAARARTLRDQLEREAPGLFERGRTKEIRRRLETLWRTLEREENDRGNLRGIQTGLLRTISRCEQEFVRALDAQPQPSFGSPKTTLPEDPCLTYAVLGDEVVGFLAAGGRVTSWACGPLRPIRAAADAFAFQVTRHLYGPAEPEPALAALDKLSLRLLGAAGPITKHKSLVVILPPELGDIPIEALPLDGAPLLRSVAVSHAASAAGTRPVWRMRGEALLVGIEDERLPEVRKELRFVRRALGRTRLLADCDATREEILRQLGGRRLVHIAGHARTRTEVPMLSALRSRDGWITAQDLGELSLEGALVVLSACRTGDPALQWRGEALAGFPWALIGAGASALVASRWEIRDEVAHAWMRRFYRELRNATPDVAAAVSGRAVRKQFPHPADWAAFLTIRGITKR